MPEKKYDPEDFAASSGRQGRRSVKARQAGDPAAARALSAPSERPLEDSERCGALTGPSAKHPYCRMPKGYGTNHPGYGNCTKHGGNTEAGVKFAMREMGRDLITRYKTDFNRFGGDRRDPSIAKLTPELALLEEVRRSAAMVRFLEERIALWNLSPPDQATIEAFAATPPRARTPEEKQKVQEVERFLDSLPSDNPDSPGHLPPLTTVHPKTGLTSFTDAREWLYLYREERAHLARTAKMAIDAGVAQRLVTLAEDQGRILSSAIRAVLQALNLTQDQQALIPVIVPPIIRAVATDNPIPDISSLMLPEASGE